MKAVITLSGGIDSTTLLYDILYQGYKPEAITFNYGQKHSKEVKYAENICKANNIPHTIVNMKTIENILETDSIVVPNRNMILLSLAIAYAIKNNIDKVFYGANADDYEQFPDCRPEFVEAMNDLAKYCDEKPVQIFAPYINLTKEDILRKGIELGIDYKQTWTCYKGEEKPCGECDSCIKRLKAFENIGMKDPLEVI